MNRITLDEMLMRMAEITALRGTCKRKSVGAVIARDTRVISTGYVGAPSGMPHCLDIGCDIGSEGGCIRTLHAESNAIAFAARKGISVEDSVMYITLSPCLPCAKLIVSAGIYRVWYANAYRDDAGVKYLQSAGIECGELIR